MAVDENVKIKGELEIDKKALADNLKTALDPIKKFAKKAATLLGALSVGSLLKEGFESAIETEQTGIRINTVLKNRFGLEKSVSDEINRQSASLAERSIFRQKELQAAQETFLLNSETTAGMEQALEAASLYTTALSGANSSASDLSNTMAKIVDAARYGNFQQFENQFGGEVGLSQEQIASLSQYSTQSERLNALLAIMKQNFGETAAEVKGSFGGSLKETKGRFEDLSTSVAQNILPALTGVFDAVNAISDAFGGLQNIMIGFMLFFLGKFLFGFITTTLPAILGMGVAQAFSQGGLPGFIAGTAIAGAIAGTVGVAIAGISSLKSSMTSTKKTSDTTAGASAMNKASNYNSQYNPTINLEAKVNTDPIKGTVAEIKRVSNVGSSSRY